MAESIKEVKAPWKPFIGDIPFHMEYDQGTIFQAMEKAANRFPEYIAYEFMGTKVTYRKLLEQVRLCARAYKAIGVRNGDRVTLALPNCPQAVLSFYALSCIGAIANMVHPLSAQNELEFFINESESVTVVTLDQFYNKIEAIRRNTKLLNIVIASVKDELSPALRTGYMLTEGRKIAKIPKDAPIIRWKKFMNYHKYWEWEYQYDTEPDDTAVILYSGGTTGRTKGIELTNLNFNALGAQIIATNPMFRPGDVMLAAMPVFHGFGLGVCIHAMLISGGTSSLVPRFTPKSYSKLITRNKCNFIAGVPTLYEALIHEPSMVGADLSRLKGVYSGGDSLSIGLKKSIDKFLYDHGSPVQVREGYGATETVNACCLTPPTMFKEGSIGIPFPDTYFKIVKPGTEEEVPYGEEGEIVVAGPTAMKGYLKHPDETADTIKVHADGLRWVYTGDLGYMDEDGFVYFRGRIKRMIVSSGYNIYPAEMENILDASEMVHMSCVIGVPDPYRMQKVKAFVVLEPGYEPNDETRKQLMDYCRKNISKYAMPYKIEFRKTLPTTVVGKVAYRVLEQEEAELEKDERHPED
ncbi:MAG: AMP-binding protein [Parasporobacterium sp.]|nr:AMP-binding protein [Parasporobacterium sp.]